MMARSQKNASLLLLFAERCVGCIRDVVVLKVNWKRIDKSDMYKSANWNIIGLSRHKIKLTVL